ncbi:MAG: anti-sigma F factor [Oscillospiraceae bacterium]|jgi:stage II sporulation protein AB (anti-sigma F factor)|nr:anti-sigma F factor [Oscillospiraceae bacterium]
MTENNEIINQIDLSFPSKSCNEAFSRAAISAFIVQVDPTIDELTDIKTAVSEAVTNCIAHGYESKIGVIYINAKILFNNKIIIKIRDKGKGIEDVKQAMEPLFTTGGSERSGLGFAVMQSFMDKVKVSSTVERGTIVTLEKAIIRASNRVSENGVRS